MRSSLSIASASVLVSLAVFGCKPPNDTSNDQPVPPIATDACEPWDCGGFPDGEQVLCPDGVTVSGPTGECVAHGSECAWKVVSCPETPECEVEDCGAPSPVPNYLCTDDRTISGPTGRCLKKGSTCQWEIKKCPAGAEICPDRDCGPSPMLPNWVCPDGETVAGPTGVCQKKTDGSCAWEVVQCSPVN